MAAQLVDRMVDWMAQYWAGWKEASRVAPKAVLMDSPTVDLLV
jgi:hypothetical protein